MSSILHADHFGIMPLSLLDPAEPNNVGLMVLTNAQFYSPHFFLVLNIALSGVTLKNFFAPIIGYKTFGRWVGSRDMETLLGGKEDAEKTLAFIEYLFS